MTLLAWIMAWGLVAIALTILDAWSHDFYRLLAAVSLLALATGVAHADGKHQERDKTVGALCELLEAIDQHENLTIPDIEERCS